MGLSQGPCNQLAEPIQILSARFLSCYKLSYQCPIAQELRKADGDLGKRHYGKFRDQIRGLFWKFWKFKENRCYYLGKRKMTNMLKEFRKDQKDERSQPLLKRRGYIFCGDDGEGDVIAGIKMLEHKKLGNRMKAVLIHKVETNDRNIKEKNKRRRKIEKAAKAKGKIVIFHENVEDAAIKALQQGLISKDSYTKVMKAIDPNFEIGRGQPQSPRNS